MSQQQPRNISSSSSSSSSALVSTKQRSAVLKLLSTAVRTRKLSDLKQYLTQNGDPNTIVYFAVSDSETRSPWYVDAADHTGPDPMAEAPLLYLFCFEGTPGHVLALIGAGADVGGRGHERSPLMGAAISH
jgi:hypothetical protein